MAKKEKGEKAAVAVEIPPEHRIPLEEKTSFDISEIEVIREIPADEQAPAEALADEQAMLGRMTPLERARFAFGLEPAHVLGAKEHPQPDGSVRVVLVTQGGQRLRWPEDEGRVLAQHEKDGTVPGAPPAGIFGAKK